MEVDVEGILAKLISFSVNLFLLSVAAVSHVLDLVAGAAVALRTVATVQDLVTDPGLAQGPRMPETRAGLEAEANPEAGLLLGTSQEIVPETSREIVLVPGNAAGAGLVTERIMGMSTQL